MNIRIISIRLGIGTAVVGLAMVLMVGYVLYASLPDLTGEVSIQGIELPAEVEFDRFGIPSISASSRSDAFKVLGFLIARDRLFQMDLMRRKSAGLLAELFGEPAVQTDIFQRKLGLGAAARDIVRNLPWDQKKVLLAYVEGVNAYIQHTETLPFEFVTLGYHPEPWKPEDSMLVALAMFQQLSWNQHDERMLTVMRTVLPPEVVAFFTPDSDEFDSVLLGGQESRRPIQPIPIKALSSLLQSVTAKTDVNVVTTNSAWIGSNQWAVSGTKTVDGRAILANDMHLALTVPNLWYRAKIHYDDIELSGMLIPGLPLFIAGTNNKIAWGHTNVLADVLDLVTLEINPGNSSEYLSPDGWKSFVTVKETIKVKNNDARVIEIKKTIWGPVDSKPLLGQPVAVRWTAVLPDTVNMEMLYLDKVETLEQTISIFNRSGIPPTNIMLADDQGRIAWTLAGKFPLRHGFDGSTSHSWSTGSVGWDSYINPEELPKVIDPPTGFLATANNRTLGSQYPYVIGHNYAHSYRAFRISQRLKNMKQIEETDMLKLQLDTKTEFYEFYRNLALSVLTEEAVGENTDLYDVRQALTQWDGKADVNSEGLPVLVEFRRRLAHQVITPYLSACLQRDPSFFYRWYKIETPLRRLLTEKVPAILPNRRYGNWDALIVETLKESIINLKGKFAVRSIADLNWGYTNSLAISHPFSQVLPILRYFLDMPIREMSGCNYCVNVVVKKYGATERMVISPGKSEDGILHMPTGQSGHPLSPHYDDQHWYWERGLPLPFKPVPSESILHVVSKR